MENTAQNKMVKRNYKTTFSYFILALAFIAVLYYMLGPSEGYLHSDCVDTMTWAQGSIESGRFYSTTFCYPYLLPFGATFLFFPFVKIFGFSMFAYRLSMLVFLFVFTAALYFMLRGMKWSKELCMVTIALEFMLLSSSQKLRELFWEHIIHYSLGAMIAFGLLALVFLFLIRYSKNDFSFNKNKKVIIPALCFALWTFLSASDGLTALTLSVIPIIGALFITAVLDEKGKLFSKSNKGLFIALGIIIAATLVGLLVFGIVSSSVETTYESKYTSIVANTEWSNNMLKFLPHWTSLMGADYEVGQSITKPANVFAAVKMAGSLVLFFVPVFALFIYNKLNRHEKIFLLFHWFMTGFILYGFVFGNLSDVNWRLSPIVCSSAIVNVCVWKYLWSGSTAKRMTVLLSSLIILSAVITAGQIVAMPANYGRDDDHHKAVELLERNGLDYGYATYWNANILTLLSDNKVKVREIYMPEGNYTKGWLNLDLNWYEDVPSQDKYFVLLTREEYNWAEDRNHPILENTSNIIEEGNWVVLVKNENIF